MYPNREIAVGDVMWLSLEIFIGIRRCDAASRLRSHETRETDNYLWRDVDTAATNDSQRLRSQPAWLLSKSHVFCIHNRRRFVDVTDVVLRNATSAESAVHNRTSRDSRDGCDATIRDRRICAYIRSYAYTHAIDHDRCRLLMPRRRWLSKNEDNEAEISGF